VTLALASPGSPAVEERVVELRTHLTEFSLADDGRVDGIVLDPRHQILMRRPEY
jgi:hypothetical protein